MAGLVVGVLTAAGFALRLSGLDQSLFGDEIYTFAIATENDLWGVPDAVAHTSEISPPLYFGLAWLGAQVGDATTWMRVPSLILSTVTIPLVYALGLRTVGRDAGVFGAAFVAISPFGIFYGDEARAYATLAFLSVLSTLTLLWALRNGGAGRWLLFGACTAAILYTHYTGIFVVLGQAAWALWTHRAQWRAIVLVQAGVAVAYLPWIPSFLDQQDLGESMARTFAATFPLAFDTVFETVAHVVPGYPFVPPGFSYVPLKDVPGSPFVALVWAILLGAAAAALARAWRARRRGSRASGPLPALVVVLTLVTPAGLILYSVQPDTSYLVARNLSASLPAIALLMGWLLTSLRPPALAAAATAIVLATAAIGAVQALGDRYERPPYRQAAAYVDRTAAPGDPVMVPLLGIYPLEPVTPHLERAHKLLGFSHADWRRAARSRRVFVVTSESPKGMDGTTSFLGGSDSPGNADLRVLLGGSFSLAGRRSYDGLFRVEVSEYTR